VLIEPVAYLLQCGVHGDRAPTVTVVVEDAEGCQLVAFVLIDGAAPVDGMKSHRALHDGNPDLYPVMLFLPRFTATMVRARVP